MSSNIIMIVLYKLKLMKNEKLLFSIGIFQSPFKNVTFFNTFHPINLTVQLLIVRINVVCCESSVYRN